MSITRDDESVQYDDRSYTQRLEDRIHVMEMERIYEDELMANSYLSPAHKIVLRAIRQIIHNLQIDESTPTIIHLKQLVHKTALSDRQIARLTDELHQFGAITKETRQWKEGKKWISEMKISLGGIIRYSVKDLKTTHKRPGGAQKCHNCGSANIEAVIYKCRDCGHHGPFDD